MNYIIVTTEERDWLLLNHPTFIKGEPTLQSEFWRVEFTHSLDLTLIFGWGRMFEIHKKLSEYGK